MATRWFRLDAGRIRFAGSITRPPLERWLQGAEGAALVALVERDVRLALFGRQRAARRRIWKMAAAAVTAAPVRQVIEREAERYPAQLTALAYTDALPHLHVDLHRLVAVPRALVDNTIFPTLVARLEEQPAFAALDRSLKLFLAARLVTEMDAALAGARPRVERPVPTWEQWASVGLNGEVAWTLPSSAGASVRNGHFYVFEMPRTGIARRTRKRIATAVAELDAAIASLSRAERVDIIGRVLTGATWC